MKLTMKIHLILYKRTAITIGSCVLGMCIYKIKANIEKTEIKII